MEDWNSTQYLKFEAERTQPAIDLARRMNLNSPSRLADIGCGPGNSTRVLQTLYPSAAVLGLDSSSNMLEAARKACPGARFLLCNISRGLPEESGFDAIFSNACLQWVPDHRSLLPRLFSLLSPGGALAVQIPFNQREPIHQIIDSLASSARWSGYFDSPRTFYTLSESEYYEILSGLSNDFSLWCTTYIHVLKSHGAILEWYRTTGLKPYLDALPPEKGREFEKNVMEEVRKWYPPQKDGKILFRFPRLFFIAYKK